MSRNSDTRDYPAARANGRSPYASGPSRKRRNRGKQIFLAVIIAVLAIIVAIALVFIIRDFANRQGNDPTVDTSAGVGTGTGTDVPEETDALSGGASYAIDGNVATYLLSSADQSVGSYLLIDIGEETEIMSVSLLSSDADLYIREADIQLSSDGQNWTTFGTFTGSAGKEAPVTVTKGAAIRASYVRIVLTQAEKGKKWVIHNVEIRTPDGTAVTPRDAMTGIITAEIVVTKAPDATTELAAGFQEVSRSNAEIHSGTLILVDKTHEFIFPTSNADILPMYSNRTEVTLPNGTSVLPYSVGGSALPAMKAEALQRFNQMAAAFTQETGLNVLHVGENDAWRSYETQAALAAKYSTALPSGLSDHNTGLSANVSIHVETGYYQLSDTQSPVCGQTLSWLTANCYKYGFIDRYPASKDAITGLSIDRYHYRYVGYAHAWYMYRNNLCLEEYLEVLHGHPYEGEHLKFTAENGTSYEMYYVPMTSGSTVTNVHIPTDRPYTLSGDNMGGFIVTIEG